jgi:thiamine-monophosphate kinase
VSRTEHVSEFELIDRFTGAFPLRAKHLSLGIGDDTALLRARPGFELAVTVDSLVEGVHFTRAFSPEQIGHKALAVNLSDLASMGASPFCFFCALALPRSWVPKLSALARGMAQLARKHGCALAGGNFTRASELSVSITALGWVEQGGALRRSGARIGDEIFVSGELGGAAAGLKPRASAALLARQRTPDPRIGLGRAVRRWAHAAIDISDGLAQDLGHLLRASKVSATIDLARVPVANGATLQQAVSGGEDYELLLAVPPKHRDRVLVAAKEVDVPLTAIGEIWQGRPGRVTWAKVPKGGGWHPGGHDHFK